MFEKIIKKFIKNNNKSVNIDLKIKAIEMFLLPLMDQIHFLLSKDSSIHNSACQLSNKVVSNIFNKKNILNSKQVSFILGIAPLSDRADFIAYRLLITMKNTC
ncbi:hypothetical protein M153_1920005767 [Pseudoloma neurophilia]|uniref:Uncharacterized protein n=1 Tax=Pseudoloma neurophilia TaxID=146866 RepID=A0A0R0LZE7_9MICR|nr:hypothetical protein M153_1920005767 [Pseudoloma neurophilia]